MHGRQILDVLGSGSYDVTRVDYFLSGSELAKTLVATGVMSNLGWYTVWNTSKVPNGSYTIEASVRDSEGRGIITPIIDVRVANGQPDRSARVADRVAWSSWASSMRVVVDYAQVIGRAETCPNPRVPGEFTSTREAPRSAVAVGRGNGEPFSAVAGAESAPQLVGRASLDLATLGLKEWGRCPQCWSSRGRSCLASASQFPRLLIEIHREPAVVAREVARVAARPDWCPRPAL